MTYSHNQCRSCRTRALLRTGLYVLVEDVKVISSLVGEFRGNVQRLYRMAMICNPSGVGAASTERVL